MDALSISGKYTEIPVSEKNGTELKEVNTSSD